MDLAHISKSIGYRSTGLFLDCQFYSTDLYFYPYATQFWFAVSAEIKSSNFVILFQDYLGAGGVAQVVKQLSSKHEAMSSNTSITKKKKKDIEDCLGYSWPLPILSEFKNLVVRILIGIALEYWHVNNSVPFPWTQEFKCSFNNVL
jgi:hypothetical protein